MRTLSILLCAAVLLSGPASAQGWPEKPVRIVAAAAPGGGVDFIARLAAQSFSEQLKQGFVVDNRPGAGGTIATNQVAKAQADGYTLLVSANAELTLAPHIRQDLPYDPLQELAPVMLVASAPLLIVVHPELPATNARELFEYARSKGSMGYGTPGSGSNAHIAFELLRSEANLPFHHVPYKGGGPTVADLVGGHLQVALVNTPPVMGAINGGKARAIAVVQATRSKLLPNVPTVKESTGFDTREAASWFAIMAPAGTPREILARLERAALAMFTPQVRARLADAALDIVALPGERFGALMRSESSANQAAVKRIGFKPQ